MRHEAISEKGGTARLRGRAAWVSGVEAPLGAALARALAEAGARVRVASFDHSVAEALAREIGGEACALEGVPSAGPLDILVEATPLPPLPADLGALEEALAAAARPVLRLGSSAACLARGGSALLVSAPLGATPGGGWLGPVLAFREAAVQGLARDLAPRGVRVNGLAPVLGDGARLPGFLAAGAKAPTATPLGRAASHAEVAEAALWLLGAGMATGLTLPLDGGRRLAGASTLG